MTILQMVVLFSLHGQVVPLPLLILIVFFFSAFSVSFDGRKHEQQSLKKRGSSSFTFSNSLSFGGILFFRSEG